MDESKKELKNNVDFHNEELSQQKRGSDIYGMFQTVASAPTETPSNWFNQIQIICSYKSNDYLDNVKEKLQKNTI